MVSTAEGGKRKRKSPMSVDFVTEPVIKKKIAKKVGASPVRHHESKIREIATHPDATTCEDAQTDIFASFSRLTSRRKSTVPHVSKSYWRETEDDALTHLVRKYGPNEWKAYAKVIPGRTGKQCRERWVNHLNPTINKGAFTSKEDATIAQAVCEMGYKWADIASLLPGRTDNLVKNRYNQRVPIFVPSKLGQYKYIHNDNETDEWSILQELQMRAVLKPQRAQRDPWSHDEDERLIMAVAASTDAGVKWKDISRAVGTRITMACKRRWSALHPAGDTRVRVASDSKGIEGRGGDCYCDDLETSSLEDVMAAYSDDTTYGLLSIEEYSEGRSYKDDRPTHSYYMTVGTEHGLRFSYPPRINANLVRRKYSGKETRDVLWYLTPSTLKSTKLPPPLLPPTPKPPVVENVIPHKTAVLQYSMTAYFSEVKRREEEEALAKSVFA